jgi:RecB family exonuclease
VTQLVNWSFSKLLSYEGCPFRVKLRYIDRIPEPPRDPKTDPLERGNRIHDVFEKAIKTNALPPCEARSYEKFHAMLNHLHKLYDAGMATAEDDWLFDVDWNPCNKDNYWLWMKLDYSAQDELEGLVVLGDWKSGKSQYKTVEHIQQTQLYAGAVALRYPWADKIATEIAYVDEGHIKTINYTREQALRFIGQYQQRADRMLADKYFRPNPNKVTCKWCPYGPQNGNGHCPVGV